jgi:hypothetical protein
MGSGVDGRAGSGEGAGTASAPSTPNQKLAHDLDGESVVQRRHGDWAEHQMRWRWLLDSYEGGDRYRNAVYGPDRRGMPCRNLFRHRREYPDPQMYPGFSLYEGYPGGPGGPGMSETGGSQTGLGPFPGQLGADAGAVAMDDDYELRRARTPIPEFVAEAVEIHLAKVYDQEVARKGPPDLTEWWIDVDGRGTPIDDYMRETIAPLLLVLGNLDVCLDHPQAPPGETVATRADELRLGLDKCVASYILPQNMLWWRTDSAGRYTECLVREYANPSDRKDTDEEGNPIDAEGGGDSSEAWRRNYVRFRLWNTTESILFSADGDEVMERIPHNFGRVPIVRLMDLKKHRTPNIGKSRYEAVAEYQREYYNRDSELILSDTLQAHPFLSGAEDFCKADNTLSIGPGYVLPMKKNVESGTYQGWEFVSPPKDPAESLRKNKSDIERLKDRATCQEAPASAAGGTAGSTTGLSGISKQLDAHTGHKKLKSIAQSLAKAERFLAEYAAIVLRAREITPEERRQILVIYPSRFELFSAEELTDGTTKLQTVVAGAGKLPMTEGMAIRSIVRQLLLGLTDKEYHQLDDEIDLAMATQATLIEERREMMPDAGVTDASAATEGPGSSEEDAGADPTGESAATMVSTVTTGS